ncbi:MAG: T9SS type A sorting domain-containing protein [Candidatus Eisenbacteria bacterium]
MRGLFLSVSFVALAALVVARPALAQWIPNGVLLSGGGLSGDANRIVSDGVGGAYVAWRKGTNSDDVFLQRVTASGMLVPGWPVAGLPIATDAVSEQLIAAEPDGLGGVIVVWSAFYSTSPTGRDHFLQRVGPDGTLAAGWPVGGLRLPVPGSQYFAELADDGSGGVYIVWEDDREYLVNGEDVYALHLLADGAVAPGWPADGLPIAVGTFWSGLLSAVPDGSGGAFFVWHDDRLNPGWLGTFGTRVHADGSLASGWNPNGNFLSPWGFLTACGDGATGIYVLSTDANPYYAVETNFYLHRFGPTGAPAPGWTTNGIVGCDAAGFRDGHELVPDGRGGAFAAWYDSRGGAEIYAIRILPDGSLAPGWTEDGTLVSDPANLQGGDFDPRLVDDGAGGAFLTWDSNGLAMVQHLNATGQAAPGWPEYGVRVATTRRQDEPRIATDGEGGAIVAWNEGDFGRHGVWAQRYVADGIVAVHLSLTSATAEADRVRLEWYAAGGAGLTARLERRSEGGEWRAMATITADGSGHLRYEDREVTPASRYAYRLVYRDDGFERVTSETWVDVPAELDLALAGFLPNPAVGSPQVAFTLPRAGLGRIELFDLAGRRVAERDLAGIPAGRHALLLAASAGLPPAAYVIRLTHGGRTITARGVVVR